MKLPKLPELPSTFSPNEYITIPTSMVKKQLRPIGYKVSGLFPSRIHIAPIDCNRFAYGQPGGGGIGFGILSKNELTLTSSESFHYEGPKLYRPVARRAAAVAEKSFDLNNSFQVTLKLSPEVTPHSGFGSNAVIMSSILFAVNSLFDRPFADEEVRLLVAANFAESNKGMCCPGLGTGLASAIVAYGGFNLVGDRTHHIWQNPAQYLPDVYLAKPDVSRPEFSGSEDEVMLARSLREDADHRGIRSYSILMDLIPAIEEEDLDAIGDVIWRIQFGGTHLSMIQRYGHQGAEIYDFICNARTEGIEMVGMSSVGRAFFLISKNPKRVELYLKKREVEYFKRQIQTAPIYSSLKVK